MGTLRLIHNMEVDPVLVLVAMARGVVVDWAALPDKEWTSYDYT